MYCWDMPWVSRAEINGLRARVVGLEAQNGWLMSQNQWLTGQIIQLSARPTPSPVVVKADPFPIEAILEGVKGIVNPNIIYNPPDESESNLTVSRKGVDWSQFGLDNNGGVGDSPRDILGQVPDYVLAVEGVNPRSVAKGGWVGGDTISPITEAENRTGPMRGQQNGAIQES